MLIPIVILLAGVVSILYSLHDWNLKCRRAKEALDPYKAQIPRGLLK